MSNSSIRKKSLSLGQVELIYVKSKCYLHPTTSKRDNVAGFLTISRGPNSTNNDYLISFTVEQQLKKEDLKVYQQADLDEPESIDGDGLKPFRIVDKPPTSMLSGYSFSIPISFIYSIQVRNPSMGMWFGSIIINTLDGEKLPIVFFHDDESPSTKKRQKTRNQNFETFGDSGSLFWGGTEFIQILSRYSHLVKSTVEPSVYLVNPVSDDLRNFAPFKEKPKDTENKNSRTSSESFQLPDFNKLITNAKWKVLETVATFTAKTKNQVVDVVNEHAPLPIKQLIKQPEVQKIGNEFEGARVYLAKWAAQVKEEAEESQRKFYVNDEMYSIISKELGNDLLTDEEVNKTNRRNEISKSEWDSFFDYSGRLRITVEEIKDRIFHGGVSASIRGEVWLFLLDVYPWNSSKEDRDVIQASLRSKYDELKLLWVNDDIKRSTDFWKDQKHRIEKDISRTDRHLPIFKNHKKRVSISAIGSNVPPIIRESSPETPDEDDDDEFDVSNIRNPHLYKMREILLTFNEYNENLGYVQGMTDLLSPLYVILQDEALTFWSFAKFMERMERNFVRDQSGMKKQMLTLNQLVSFMLPDLFKHLERCESTDLFFFFRMLLVWFKREFEWDDVLRLWEVFLTDYYSSQHHLFFALSVLSENQRIIIQNLKRFDEVLKYMNDLSMHMHINKLLVRSELLFLKFRRMILIIDRENTTSSSNKAKVSPDLRQLLSRDIVIQKEVERPEGVGGG